MKRPGRRLKRCALAGILLCVSFVSSLAQVQPSDTSTSAPTAQVISSLPSNQNILEIVQNSLSDSTMLRQRLEARKLQAQNQVDYWQSIVSQLKSENERDKQQSIELSEKLFKAEAELQKSQTDLTAILKSLGELKTASDALSADFEFYKAEATKELRSRSLEAGLWRIVGLAGIGGCGGALFSTRALWGSGVGIGIGASIGVVWYLVEHWPPWAK